MKSLIDHLPQDIQIILIQELEDLGKEYQSIKKPFHIDEDKYPYMHKYVLNQNKEGGQKIGNEDRIK